MYGLIRPGNEPLVPYAIRMMAGVNNLSDHRGGKPVSARKSANAQNIWRLAQEFKQTFSIECKPYFVGLWDTVNSVGWFSHPFHAPYTSNNPDITLARHALAIDERRAFFQPSPWVPREPRTDARSGPRDLVQVWFPGDHSDVGGGYPEPECGLSKGSLKWMICEAAAHGLRFDVDRARRVLGMVGTEYTSPNPDGTLHRSLRGFWLIGEFIPRRVFDPATKTWPFRVNFFRKRTIPDGALVYGSAFERPGYRDHFPPTATEVSTNCPPSLPL
jgi:hypothetical protein